MRSISLDVLQASIGTAIAVTVLFASFEAPLRGQVNAIRPDPNMPTKDGFDTDRAIFWAQPNFVPFRNPDWRSLRAALRADAVGDETTVLTFEVQGRTHALVSSQMAYHHVAQGEIEGEPWMVTF